MKLNLIICKVVNGVFDDPQDSDQSPPEKPSTYPDFDGTLEDKTPRTNI